MFQASLVMLQEVLGNDKNGVYLEVLVRTAESLRLQGRVLEAEGALRQALLLSKELYDQQKLVIVADCLTSLAVILLEGTFQTLTVCLSVCLLSVYLYVCPSTMKS